MEAKDVLEGLPAWVGYLAVGAPGAWAVFKLWVDGRKDRDKQQADLMEIAERAVQRTITSLETRVKALETELTELRKEHAQSIATKDAEIALLRAELRQAWATVDVYERQLTHAGVPHEKPVQPAWRVPAGSAPTDVSPA